MTKSKLNIPESTLAVFIRENPTMTGREIAQHYGVDSNFLSSRITKLGGLRYLRCQIKPDTDSCIYYIAKNRSVCGAACSGQYCEKHKAKTSVLTNTSDTTDGFQFTHGGFKRTHKQ